MFGFLEECVHYFFRCEAASNVSNNSTLHDAGMDGMHVSMMDKSLSSLLLRKMCHFMFPGGSVVSMSSSSSCQSSSNRAWLAGLIVMWTIIVIGTLSVVVDVEVIVYVAFTTFKVQFGWRNVAPMNILSSKYLRT